MLYEAMQLEGLRQRGEEVAGEGVFRVAQGQREVEVPHLAGHLLDALGSRLLFPLAWPLSLSLSLS